ncbi:MAG: magnesium/cobalt transporter CorA [Bacteroidia bacterium]
MIRILRKGEKQTEKVERLADLDRFDGLVWIDLQDPTPTQVAEVEQKFSVNFMSEQEQTEIETSSRYVETAERIVANSNFLQAEGMEYANHPVSFILKDQLLFTYRESDLRTFADTVRKIKQLSSFSHNGAQVMLNLFESRIDLDADMIEHISKEIAGLSKGLGIHKRMDEKVLLRISEFQEMTMLLRENIFDKQRVVSAMLRSDKFEPHEHEKLRILIKDINSLLEHTAFNFERLEYLQDTFLGLINIEQNKIIKIFTVASVIFMPPTLIASIYGMNFRVMPELHWAYGYSFAIGLMVLSSMVTLYFFRKKGWL